MKTTLIASVLLLSAGAAFGDVFSDVDFWLRGGMATDANGNGLLDNNEITDAMGRRTFSTTVCDGNKSLAFTNELVRMPMRGMSATMPALYFPQTAVVTNEESGAGYARCNAFTMKNVFRDNGGTPYTDQYSFIIRFRPDAGIPLNSNWMWILNMGYGANGGLMLGLPGSGQMRTLKLFSSKMECGLCSITNTAWTDVGVSINGTNFTWVVSQTTGLNENSAGINYLTTRTGTSSNYNGGHTTKPEGANLVVGTESADSNYFAITNTPSRQWSSNNAGKAFRGSIQQIAFWKRALTMDELREALAWPNAEVLKIGVEDGSGSEFFGTGTSGAATMDDRAWNIPATLAAGGELTFRFVLKDRNNHNLPQVFRWIATPQSASGLLRVTVNGKTVTSRTSLAVQPGKRARLFIDGSYFRAGENTLTVTRMDAGAQPLRLDAVVLGGSWMVGLNDSSYSEFVHESSTIANYWTLDGNWKSVRRAFLGAGNSNSNQFWHINMPADLAGRYAARLTYRILSNAMADTELVLSFDGKEFARKTKPAGGDTFTLDLDPEDLEPGEHILYMSNGKGSGSNYWSPDYVKFELFAPNDGTMLIVR